VTNLLHTFPRNASVTIASTLCEQSAKGLRVQLTSATYFHFHFTTVAVALAACQESKVDAGINTRITPDLLPCLTLPQLFTPAIALHRSFPTRPSPTLLPFASAAGSQSLVIILHQCTSARHAKTQKPSLHSTVTRAFQNIRFIFSMKSIVIAGALAAILGTASGRPLSMSWSRKSE
jgi:hypothetical protein